jgi:AcrR family transcriptional regulator
MRTEAKPPRRLPKSASTIATILEAAAHLFVSRSYAEVAMNDIATDAQLTKGALYHHFSSKETVYVEMLKLKLTSLEDLFSNALTVGETCRDRLRTLVASFLSLSSDERGVMQLLRRDINIFSGDTRTELIRAYQNALPVPVQQVLRTGMDTGELRSTDVRLLSWLFIALVETMLNDYAAGLFECEDDRIDYAIDLFLTGASHHKGNSK